MIPSLIIDPLPEGRHRKGVSKTVTADRHAIN
jgi:hypothetical protein